MRRQKSRVEINYEVLRLQAEFCKGMAHPKRILILQILTSGEKTVSDLAAATGIPQANLSQHLAFLRQQGLLRTRRDGNNIYYSITDKRIADACNIVKETIEEKLKQAQKMLQASR